MKNNKLSFILYLIAVLLISIPISIALVTDNTFNSFYSEIFVNTAIIFVIVGSILTVVKKTIADRKVQWDGIGSITGLLILLIWEVMR